MKNNAVLATTIGILLSMTQLSAEAASATNHFTSMCNRAGGTLVTNVILESYISSTTKQDEYSAFVRVNKTDVWQIAQIDSHTNQEQNSNIREMKKLASTAFLTGSSINICTDTGTTPNTVWAIEQTY